MVVLLRAFTHVAAYERVLSEAGLDPYVVGGRGFWSQQQVEDMRALLAVIANPLDDEALFGALASPAGGAVLPDTLWLLRAAASSPPREEGQRERTNHIWPLLRDLHAEGAPSPENGFADRAARIPDDELARLNAFTATVIDLRRRGSRGWARDARRERGERVRLRPRDADARPRPRALGERAQADAARAGVRVPRGP